VKTCTPGEGRKRVVHQFTNCQGLLILAVLTFVFLRILGYLRFEMNGISAITAVPISVSLEGKPCVLCCSV